MKRVMRLLASIVGGVLSLGAGAALAQAPPAAAFAPLAHSDTLAVEGSVASATLVLRVHRLDQQPLKVTELGVRLDGRPLPVLARADGSWSAPLRDLAAHSPGKLEILIAHDGAVEALDARLPASTPAPAAATGTTAGGWSALIHKQMSWWILNVIIVLVGVIAVSRRMS